MRFVCLRAASIVMVAVLAGAGDPAKAQSAPAPDRWSYSLTPYLWLPSVEGTLKYHLPPGNGSPTVEVSRETLLETLEFGAMLAGEARRGRWSIFGDYIYLKLSGAKSVVRTLDFNQGLSPVSPASTTVDRGTDSGLKGSLFTLVAGYNISGSNESPADVIVGLRYFGVTATTGWRFSAAVAGSSPGQTFSANGSISKNEDLWDAVVGLRGRARLADRWHLPYHFDVGGGSSSLTWQAMLGMSYSFKWGEATLAYRHLSYDQNGDKLLQNFKFSGPLLGATFRF
jgi:hypothetical protein